MTETNSKSYLDKGKDQHSMLLTFAHRGEARAFLQEFKSLALDSDFYHLKTPYPGLNAYLLITGEGFEESMTTLSYILGKYSDINEIINYGVCGLLRQEMALKINDLVAIRNVYADSKSKKMAFKSFPLAQKAGPSYDLVSTHERVLEPEKADFYDNFAPLIDRELWAQAYCAQKWNIPIASFKVISDYADGEICQQVKESSSLWSDKLLRHFIHQCESPEQLIASEEKSLIDTFFTTLEKESFHITVSQERSLQRLLQAHKIKGQVFKDLKEKIELTNLINQKIRPKERTKELLLKLSEHLNPMELRLKKQLKNITYPLEKLSVQVKHDQDFEKEKLHLSMTLQSKEDFERLAEALNRFPYEKWTRILRGEDV